MCILITVLYFKTTTVTHNTLYNLQHEPHAVSNNSGLDLQPSSSELSDDSSVDSAELAELCVQYANAQDESGFDFLIRIGIMDENLLEKVASLDWTLRDDTLISTKHDIPEIVLLEIDGDLYPIKTGLGDKYDPFLQKLLRFEYGLRLVLGDGSCFLHALCEHVRLMGYEDMTTASLRQKYLEWVTDEYNKGDDSDYSHRLHYKLDNNDAGVHLGEDNIVPLHHTCN